MVVVGMILNFKEQSIGADPLYFNTISFPEWPRRVDGVIDPTLICCDILGSARHEALSFGQPCVCPSVFVSGVIPLQTLI